MNVNTISKNPTITSSNALFLVYRANWVKRQKRNKRPIKRIGKWFGNFYATFSGK